MPYTATDAVAFAQRPTGRYKDGECWTLMEDAVVASGGKSSIGLTPNFGKDVSYVWGTAVNVMALAPGDVLQFVRYVWRKATRVDVNGPEGTSFSENYWDEGRGLPHHSAMVVRVVSAGVVEVVEQNIPPTTGPVQTVELVLVAPATSTSVTQEKGKDGVITTTTKVTHQVSGQIKCYRPIPV
jgi:hypothetical protein